MEFIPAIDLKDGACVRLLQGRMDTVRSFSDDPLAVARHWAEQGARLLHVVDLDGAVTGKPVHFETIKAILQENLGLQIQVGGGIRSEAVIQDYLTTGASRIVLGTSAINDHYFLETMALQFSDTILIGLDVRQNKLAIEGWKASADAGVAKMLQISSELPVAGIVYTDIERDGMQKGLNIEATVAVAKQSKVPIFASGGVSSLTDLHNLVQAQHKAGVMLGGVIVGRALYEGKINVSVAIDVCEQVG